MAKVSDPYNNHGNRSVTFQKASEGTPGRQITGGTSTRRTAWPRSVTLIIIRGQRSMTFPTASEDSLMKMITGGTSTRRMAWPRSVTLKIIRVKGQ